MHWDRYYLLLLFILLLFVHTQACGNSHVGGPVSVCLFAFVEAHEYTIICVDCTLIDTQEFMKCEGNF